MPNIVKTMVVDELTREFKDAGGMLLVSFCGLTVSETEDLRNALAAQGLKFRMIRNSLAKLAFAEVGLEFDSGSFAGNTAVAYGPGEAAIHAAKIFSTKEIKKLGKVELRAALLEGSVLDANNTRALADVPDRDELHAMLLGAISGPGRSLLSIINAVPGALVRVIQAHVDDAEVAPQAETSSNAAGDVADGAATESESQDAPAEVEEAGADANPEASPDDTGADAAADSADESDTTDGAAEAADTGGNSDPGAAPASEDESAAPEE